MKSFVIFSLWETIDDSAPFFPQALKAIFCSLKSTAKSSKVDCVDKGLTRPQVMQRLSPPTVALICWFSFLT